MVGVRLRSTGRNTSSARIAVNVGISSGAELHYYCHRCLIADRTCLQVFGFRMVGKQQWSCGFFSGRHIFSSPLRLFSLAGPCLSVNGTLRLQAGAAVDFNDCYNSGTDEDAKHGGALSVKQNLEVNGGRLAFRNCKSAAGHGGGLYVPGGAAACWWLGVFEPVSRKRSTCPSMICAWEKELQQKRNFLRQTGGQAASRWQRVSCAQRLAAPPAKEARETLRACRSQARSYCCRLLFYCHK